MGFLTKDLPQALQTFPIDVFLSYSHGAFSGKSSTRLKAWSQKLADDLREELLQLDLEDLSLFIDSSDREDEGVDRTARLAEQLKDRVEGAAVLVVLMSAPYLRSRWCSQERDWWMGHNSPDPLAVGGRVFVCRAQPTDELAWPEVLKGFFGYCFYDKDKRPDLARPFTYGGATGDLDEYLDTLVRLAGDIAQRLKAVRAVLDDRRRQWQQQQRAAAETGQILYLYGRREHAPSWTEACERLQDRRFVINPDRPESVSETGGLDPESRSQIALSDGLLILGTPDGRALDSDMVVVGRSYRHLAIASRRSPLPCAVFDTVGAELQDARRRSNAANLGIAWIDGTRDDWPEHITGWLRQGVG